MSRHFATAARKSLLLRGLRGWVSAGPLALLRSPLIGNGYALVASAAVTSVLGVAFWIVATNIYSPEAIGLGAALISTLMTLGNFAQLNMGNALNRFLANAGHRAPTFILRTYLAGSIVAFIGASVLALVIGRFVEPLEILTETAAGFLGFAFGATLWTVFALQDSALAGLRRAVYVPVENTFYALAKLAMLPLLAGGGFVLGGVFAAWTLPLIPVIIGVNALIFLRVLPGLRGTAGELPPIRTLLSFIGWDYLGAVTMMAAVGFAPLLILSVEGASANAVYYLSWTIAYSLYLVGRSMGVSLVAESAADPQRLRGLAAETLLHSLLPLVAAAVVVIPLAPYLMQLFGPVYAAEGPPVLRVLVVACLPWTVVTIYIAIQRAKGHTRRVAAAQIATVLLMAVAAILLVGPYGAVGVATAWLIAHGVVGLAVVAHSVMANGRTSALEWAFAVASSAARLARTVKSAGPALPRRLTEEETALVDTSDAVGGRRLRPLKAMHTRCDVSTILLGRGNKGGDPRAVLKSADSQSGRASLQRAETALRDMGRDKRLAGIGFRIPAPLAASHGPERSMLVEEAVPGEDGRHVFARNHRRPAALAAAIGAAAAFHTKTAAPVEIDADWISRWIDEPVDRLGRPSRALLPLQARLSAAAAFRRELTGHFAGRTLPLGRGHGDFSPGNVMFARGGETVAAVVDWETSRHDAPPGFDAMHFILVCRALGRAEELGPVVRDLLVDPVLQPPELAALDAAGLNLDALAATNGGGLRGLVALAWLHHAAANVGKSERFVGNRLWTAVNVDWVLELWLEQPSGVTT